MKAALESDERMNSCCCWLLTKRPCFKTTLLLLAALCLAANLGFTPEHRPTARKFDLEAVDEADVSESPMLSIGAEIQRRLETVDARLGVNCSLIVDVQDAAELEAASAKVRHFRRFLETPAGNGTREPAPELFDELRSLADERFIFPPSQCEDFIRSRGYYDYEISESELEHPIAFSLLTYENVEQFERLLHAIYRRSNVYCVHVDAKSAASVHAAVRSIVRCFPNVFVASKLEHIVYAGFQRLQADINCMRDLLNTSRTELSWRYLLNVASSEFPLRTNRELVQILRVFNGTNDIEIIHFSAGQLGRVKYRWRTVATKHANYLYRTRELKTPPPFNYTLVKGIVYCAFSRAFVEYALSDERARALLAWSQDTYSPDEWYWATLQYNVQFAPPGSYAAFKSTYITTKARFIGWRDQYKCAGGGRLRHNICVFSLGDLNYLSRRNELFLNKLELRQDPITYRCMEDWLSRRLAASSSTSSFDLRPYCNFLRKLAGEARC